MIFRYVYNECLLSKMSVIQVMSVINCMSYNL